MTMKIRHPYHIVNESPWPLWGSLGGAAFLSSSLYFWISGLYFPWLISLSVLLLISYLWWKDVASEGQFTGNHTFGVQDGIRSGMILFILSEVMFFVSFFWCFFHSSLSPESVVGNWPPAGLVPLDPFTVPLVNTLVLLSSGVTVTWSHHSLMSGFHKDAITGLFATIMLGGLFTLLQFIEYMESTFSMRDSVFGNVFFMTTGFHGFHVVIGSVFLMICLIRLAGGKFSNSHHTGFECSVWYWHFVDVVWLFVYLFLYIWSGL